MARIKIRRGKYYARVRIWDGIKDTEKQIPLRTESKVTANERLIAVEKKESAIKSGLDFSFPWLNDEQLTKVKRFTISEAVDKWIKIRITHGIRNKTIEINRLSMYHLMNVIGKSYPLDAIDNRHIELFVEKYRSIHSATTININLRSIKAMLNYYCKRGLLVKIPLIEQLPVEESEPIYITDGQFQSIMEIDWLDEHYKRAFFFYRETGCRLREPFFSTVNGLWLDIPKEVSKNRKARSIYLNESLIEIHAEIVSYYNEHPTNARIGYFSKQFQKALQHLSITGRKFHSLRHTYCARRMLETNGNIFKVRDEMGHRSVTTTEKYAKLDRKRLAYDFPTIMSAYAQYENDQKTAKSGFRDTDFRDTQQYLITSPRR